MANWPRDDQNELIKFYGDPGKGEVAKQLVRVTPPFQMYYAGRPLKTISFHKKAAPALTAALNEIWDHYGHDQKTIDRLGISDCGGTYNPRKIRGSSWKWSNHAYGAAIDINAEQNGFNAPDSDHNGAPGNMPAPVIAAFKRQGARWGGDYHGRKDPMHFEFCNGGPTAVGLIDLPEADGDREVYDMPDADPDSPPPAHDVAPDAPVGKPSLFKRVTAWFTGGGLSVAGFLYDYRVALIVAGCVVALVLFVLWLFGKQKVADWISRQVN